MLINFILSLKSEIVRNLVFAFAFIFAALIFSTGSVSAQKPWDVPAKSASMANPVKSSPASIAAGKSLWVKHCQSCHGKTGKGDGSKAAQLKTEPGDFTIAKFHGQSDGAIYYKTVTGRDDMPSFKKKIPDQDDIWNLVNFVRSLKK
ncbi:MAG: cytochrome c [Saprospiraceae bacterium]|nr:cytochrome c [Candidatus Vicinibacter affinis]